MLRVAFAGTPEFAVPALRALADSSHRLVGVLTQPDRPAGRGRELKKSPVKQLALELGLPLAQPAQLTSMEERAPLVQWASDVLIVVAYGLLLPPAVLTVPRLGCLNIHASLLPRWRGAAPIQRAILAGDAETGVTIMQLDEGLDTGPTLAQRRVTIAAGIDAAQLQAQLAQEGAALLIGTLDALEAGRARAEAQPREGATYARKIDKREARIDWNQSAEAIERQVRAFNPWPVAETIWRDRRVRLWEAHVTQPRAPALPAVATAVGAVPGDVIGGTEEGVEVLCGQGVLAITRLQLEGRRALPAGEFARGQPLSGARFT
jgi:methionyl-tRNA formyltransferase